MYFEPYTEIQCGSGSEVGIATGYGPDDPGIESRWGEIFRTCPDQPRGPPSLLYNGYRVFPGGKEWPGRDADPSPPSSAVVMKEQSYTSTPPMGRTACTEPQCLYKGALYLYWNTVRYFRLSRRWLWRWTYDLLGHDTIFCPEYEGSRLLRNVRTYLPN